MKTVQKICMVVLALGLLAAVGCKQPYDLSMQRNRIFVMGRLLVGKTCDVRVIWRKAPDDSAPVTVTADLTEIGGSAEQALAATDNGTWRWAGQVSPDTSGERLITITTVDDQEQQKEISKGFPVFNTDKAVAIAAGETICFAVKADGTIMAWMAEYLRDVPSAITNAVAVTGGFFALIADGTVASWGYTDNGTVMTKEVPEGLSDVVAISASDCYLALKADGKVVAWGGTFDGVCDVPAGLTDVIAISAGWGNRYFALKADGALVSWGQVATSETTTAVAVSANWTEDCPLVLNKDGKASYGVGDSNCVDIPVRANRGFRAIAAGLGFSGVGLKNDGTVVSWFFEGPLYIDYFFVNVGLKNILAIASGQNWNFRLALAEDGTVTSWVDDWDGFHDTFVPDGLK